MLVLACVVSDQFRNDVRKYHKDFIVLDAANILAATLHDSKKRDEFVSSLPFVVLSLPFVVNDVELIEPEIDLLCRIKSGNQKGFWEIVERYFNSKYIIFEFKNYAKPIKQKEVYTTEKYLYYKALRKVAIIITANGFDKHSQWAAKGSLKESGKLILLLGKDDMKKMYEMKVNQDDPSEYLLGKLDDLLSGLEK